MAVVEVQELRALPDEELATELEDAHQALFNLRFQAATRQLADVSQVRKARRKVARIRTLIWERRIIAEADREADLGAAPQTSEAESESEPDGEGASDAASEPQALEAAAGDSETGDAETDTETDAEIDQADSDQAEMADAETHDGETNEERE